MTEGIYPKWLKDSTDKKQYTWPWARVIEQKAFQSYHVAPKKLILCRFVAVLQALDPVSSTGKMVIRVQTQNIYEEYFKFSIWNAIH